MNAPMPQPNDHHQPGEQNQVPPARPSPSAGAPNSPTDAGSHYDSAPRGPHGPNGPSAASASNTSNASNASLPALPRPRLNLLLWRHDPSLRYQWILVAFATFIISMIVLAMTAVSLVLDDAQQQVKAEITIQVPPSIQGFRADGQDPDLESVATILAGTAAIADYRILSIDEVRDILRPWVGDDVELQGLPVPYVIAVERRKGGSAEPLDLLILSGKLNAINSGIVIDDHAATLTDIGRLAGAARWAAALSFLAALGLLTAIAAIAVNTALRLQRDVLDVLFLAGASDGFIARQFLFFALGFTLRGLLIGATFALFLYTALIPLLDLRAISGPWLGLSPMQGVALCLLMASVLVTVGLFTRLVVKRRLCQMY